MKFQLDPILQTHQQNLNISTVDILRYNEWYVG